MRTVLLIFRLRRSDHISDTLISLHWLRIPKRIKFKVTVLIYKVNRAPTYLGLLTFPANLPIVYSRRALRSSGTRRLVQSPVHRFAVGGQHFRLPAFSSEILYRWR